MHELNKSQQQAMEYHNGPLLIVAGAGTGKTTVITRKVAYLIAQKLAKPEEILALAFNDKAAEEIQERVDELVNIGYVDMQISTFHAFCQRILEQRGLDIALSTDFKILAQTDAWILVRKNLSKFNLNYYQPLGNPSKHIHELIKHFSKCKDELISPNDYLEYAESMKLDKDKQNQEERTRLTEIANAYHVYDQLLLDNNSLDFGDLIYYTIKLLEKRPNILKSLRERFRYILVDEFQDVNWAQYRLVKLLADKNSQLTVVGDDDQGIYSFRGASVYNIMRFKDDFPGAKEIILTQNYRSGQNILDKSYQLIQNNNPDRLETKLKVDKKLKSMASHDAEVTHIHQPTLEDEINSVVEQISKIKKADPQASWDDFAILIRANSQANPFMTALDHAGIPYEYLASSGLYRQPIVLDCLNFFKLLDNYHESTAIYRLLRLPCWEFSENDTQKITYAAKKKAISYYEALKRASEFKLSEPGIVICEKLIALIHQGLRQASGEKPRQVIYDFLAKSGYLNYLTHQENQGNREVIRQLYQLTQFFDYLKKYEENIPEARIHDFMDQFNYLTEAGEPGSLYQPNETPDSVNIITVHKAKGLEFKYVFVVNLVEDRFPTRNRGNGIEIPLKLIKEQLPEGDSHLQEERRLLYVACTRAKNKLYLTSANDYGGARSKKISRFLGEMGYEASEKTMRKKKTDLDYLPEKLEERTTFVYEIPDVFSFSQIKSYNACPYRYKLDQLIKLPPKQTHYFSFGNTIHNTLQEFYQRVRALNSTKQETLFSLPVEPKGDGNKKIKTPELKELLLIYEERWIDDWYKTKEQREKYFADGQKMLKQYYESNATRWTMPIILEGGFTIKLADFKIAGRIDRIDRLADGSLRIIDYKTGQGKDKAEGDDKEQLILYQIAVASLPQYANIGRPSQLTLYYLKDCLEVSFLGTDREIERIKIALTDSVRKIKQGNFTATPSQHACQNCHYMDICEFKL